MSLSQENENANQSGGKLLAQGAYGCVFLTKHQPRNNQFVSKLSLVQDAVLEMRNCKQLIERVGIEKFDKYFVPVVAYNKINKTEINAKTIDESGDNILTNFKKYEGTELNKCEIYKNNDTLPFLLLHIRKVDGIELLEYLYKTFDSHRPEKEKTQIFYDVEKHLQIAVNLLKNNNICHYDLHGSNMMFDFKYNTPVIIDFGLTFFDPQLFKKDETDLFKKLRRIVNYDSEFRIDWWTCEMKYLGQMIRNGVNFTEKEAEEYAQKTFANNKTYVKLIKMNNLDIFDAKKEYNKLVSFFKDISKLEVKEAAIKLLSYWNTWDNFSKAHVMLRILTGEEKLYNDPEYLNLIKKLVKEVSVIPEERI